MSTLLDALDAALAVDYAPRPPKPPRREVVYRRCPKAIKKYDPFAITYATTYDNGDFYFGSTTKPRERWQAHSNAKTMRILCVGTPEYVYEMEKRYCQRFGRHPKCRNQHLIQLPKPDARKKFEVTVRGEVYPSITAAAKAFGISQPLVSIRMRNGMTLEQALTVPLHQGKPLEKIR